jgi:phytoene dehydrogenase-like protein
MPLPGFEYDAVVVGAGPNGLAAAAHIAREGYSVMVFEANDQIGGAARSAEVTEPGFMHDLGSAVHPLGIASPVFQSLPLEDFGLRWIQPDVMLAHPYDDGSSAVQLFDLAETARRLGPDESSYISLFQPLADMWDDLSSAFLRPLLAIPKHPITLAKFGLQALLPATRLAQARFTTDDAKGLFAGIAAHSGLPFNALSSSAVGLVLATIAHTHGWPVPQGGSSAISESLAGYIRSRGGEIETGRRIRKLSELPDARVVLFDVTPRQLIGIAGEKMPSMYRKRLESYRYGPASFKVDYALDEPIPWTNDEVRKAATVHLGGTLAEIEAAEREVADGGHPERPYVLLTQPTVCDPTRVPKGKHIAWAYCHVPLGSDVDMSGRIDAQIERYAPGFGDTIRVKRVTFPAGFERENANIVEGDIMGGSSDLIQMIARPVLSPTPYRTPMDRIYLCSSSTPPGPGVHGMCGFNAALLAIKDHLSK